MKKRGIALFAVFLASAAVAAANPEVAAFRLQGSITTVPIALIAETYGIYYILRSGLRSRSIFASAYLPFTLATWLVFMFWPRYGHYYMSVGSLRLFRNELFLAESVIVGAEAIYLIFLCRVLKRPDLPPSPIWVILVSALVGNFVSFMVGGILSI
jgi:hypothetical protein